MNSSPLSRRVISLAESQTIGMAKLSRELTSKGIDIINLSLGEPDFVTPEHIRTAAKKAIDDGFTFYPPIAGFAELRQAISEKFKRENISILPRTRSSCQLAPSKVLRMSY